jgi:hypothetical protein
MDGDDYEGLSRKSIVNAYRLKSELLSREEQQKDNTSHCLIRTLDPIIVPPSKKFEHCKGARISPITFKHSLMVRICFCQYYTYYTYHILNNSLQDSPSGNSYNMSPSKVHQRLSSHENFPKGYKNKLDENSVTVSGDYIQDPRKAMSLLKSSSHCELTIPGRAADFKSEVHWRLLLRNPNA